MNSLMSMRDERCSSIEEELRQALAQLGLAHASGAEEQERAVGPVLVRKPGTERRIASDDQPGSLVLADHPLVQVILHLEQLVPPPCIILDRDARWHG